MFGSSDWGALKYFRALKSGPNLITDRRELRHEFEYPNLVSLVVTGTALGQSLDKVMMAQALFHSIPCVSVVEHWSWYKKRFETNKGLLLPDKILVNDDIAYQDAIADGLPADRLVPLGNPVLEDLALRTMGYRRDSVGLREKLALSQNKRIVIFVSEELRSYFKPGTGDYLGYDEHTVLEQLLSLLRPYDHLVIKLHPAESDDKYAHLGEKGVSIIRHATVEELDSLGDVIVGMASMLLLELAMWRNDIISFRPGATKRFIGERLGATVDATSIEQLLSVIDNGKTAASSFKSRFAGSRERIWRFLEGMAR